MSEEPAHEHSITNSIHYVIEFLEEISETVDKFFIPQIVLRFNNAFDYMLKLNENIESLKNEIESSLEVNEKVIAELEKEIGSLKDDCDEKDTLIRDIKKESEEFENELESANDKISSLEDEISDYKKQVSELERQL